MIDSVSRENFANHVVENPRIQKCIKYSKKSRNVILIAFTNVTWAGGSGIVNSVVAPHSVLSNTIRVGLRDLLRHRSRLAVMIRRSLCSMTQIMDLTSLAVGSLLGTRPVSTLPQFPT
jgi:hypothetical protein